MREESDQIERLCAKAYAQATQCSTIAPARPNDELLHELHVYQIKLEMQNETLRQTQIALEESRDRYLDLYEFAPVGYLTLNDQGMICEINHTGAALFDVTRMKLLNGHFTGFVAAEDLDRWYRYFLDVLKNNSQDNCELMLRRGDGSLFHAHLQCMHKQTATCAHSIRIVLTDITSRRQAEEKLRESELKFSVIFNKAVFAIALTRLDNAEFVDVNDAWLQLFGYTREEATGKTSQELGIGKIAAVRERIIAELEELGSVRNVELTQLTKSGDARILSTNMDMLDICGQKYVLSTMRDITERKQAETLLLESEEKLRVIFEGALDGILLVDAESQRFTNANPAFCRMLGYSFNELTRLGIADIHSQHDLFWITEPLERHLRDETQLTDDMPIRRRDGSVFYVDIKSAPVTLGDKIYIVAIFRDITERKRVETELREYQQLLRELAAQGAELREAELKHIAREVHDELGQLLTALRMDISLLRIRFGDRDPLLMANIQDMLVLVDKSIGAVRNVTANLRPPALDMGLAAAILWLGDEFAARTHTACTVQVLDDPVELDDASTLTLFRIVQESLTNVARHAQAVQVEIKIEQRGEYICVEVRDDGLGFDMGVMLAKNSFGLMGIKERAMAVGGKVEISSAPGHGTVISVHVSLFQTGRRIDD